MKKLRALLAVHKADGFRGVRDWSSAAAFYQKALFLTPGAFPIWVQLGHMRKELGEFDASEAAYLEASALRPDDADLHLQLGHLYARMGDSARASQCYSRAAALGSTDKHVLRFAPLGQPLTGRAMEASRTPDPFARGDQFRDGNDWLQAATCYREGLKKDPAAFPYWVQLGNVLKEAGKFGEAEQAYLKAMALDATDDDLYLQLGHLRAHQGDGEASARYYTKAVQFGARDRIALNAMAGRPERFEIVRDELSRQLPEGESKDRLLSRQSPYPSFAAMVVDATR